MVDQNLFLETLRGVSEIVRTAPEPMSEEEILAFFKDMELTEEQRTMILAYMQLPAELRGEHPDIEEEEDEPEEEVQEQAEEEEEVTVEKLSDSRFYRMYLDEVKQLKVSDDQALLQEYEKLLAGDSTAIETIVNSWLMRVMEIAKFYQGTAVNMEDVVQEGNMGLWMALSDIPGHVTVKSMSLYLTAKIQESMEAYIHEMTGENDQLQTLLGKLSLLKQAQQLLAEEQQTEPSLRALSEYTMMSQEEIQDLLSLQQEANE